MHIDSVGIAVVGYRVLVLGTADIVAVVSGRVDVAIGTVADNQDRRTGTPSGGLKESRQRYRGNGCVQG